MVKRGDPFEFRKVLSGEVVEALNKANNSSPGYSNITYKDMLYCDPVGAMYTKLYNRVINSRVIPESWKQFFKTLLPKPGKQGHYNEVASWRPIALLECAYKILATLLRDQLNRWIVDNELLHPLQKSLGPHDGCAEHNFLIRAILDKYYSQLVGVEFHATMLDNADAFGSVSVEIILNCWEEWV
jgi:hypothetical protein